MIPSSVPTIDLTKANIVVDGNSLSYGQTASNSWPEELGLISGFEQALIRNYAVGGQTTLNMASDIHDQIHTKQIDGKVNILVLWEMLNHIGQSGSSVNTVFNDFKNLCLGSQQAGWDYVVVINNIAVDKDPKSHYNAVQLSNVVQQLSDRLDSEYKDFSDAVVDLNSMPEFQDAHNESIYNPDLVHLTELGYKTIAIEVGKVLKSLPVKN